MHKIARATVGAEERGDYARTGATRAAATSTTGCPIKTRATGVRGGTGMDVQALHHGG